MLLDVTVEGSMVAIDAKQVTTIIAALSSTDRETQHNMKFIQRRVILDLSITNAILAKK